MLLLAIWKSLGNRITSLASVLTSRKWESRSVKPAVLPGLRAGEVYKFFHLHALRLPHENRTLITSASFSPNEFSRHKCWGGDPSFTSNPILV